MSFLSKQETELKQAQVTEALLRMKKLGLYGNAIKEFQESGKLNLSEKGILFWLDEEEKSMVREWEEETGHLVYHVIKNHMEWGRSYSFLYVSKNTEDWEMDNNLLVEGVPFVYVKNADDWGSEYGTIGIKPLFGGIIRTQ